VNLEVFVGPEINFPSDDPFSVPTRSLRPEVSLEVKNRLTSVSGLFDKLRKLRESTDQPEMEIARKKKVDVVRCQY
jgi:hypothetical protein